jgi:hypothetical protein
LVLALLGSPVTMTPAERRRAGVRGQRSVARARPGGARPRLRRRHRGRSDVRRAVARGGVPSGGQRRALARSAAPDAGARAGGAGAAAAGLGALLPRPGGGGPRELPRPRSGPARDGEPRAPGDGPRACAGGSRRRRRARRPRAHGGLRRLAFAHGGSRVARRPDDARRPAPPPQRGHRPPDPRPPGRHRRAGARPGHREAVPGRSERHPGPAPVGARPLPGGRRRPQRLHRGQQRGLQLHPVRRPARGRRSPARRARGRPGGRPPLRGGSRTRVTRG